jgi:photosystem II stability/assembly factor-like uncharacterized protein
MLSANLRRIFEMKKLLPIGLIMMLFSPGVLFAGWVRQTSGVSVALRDVHFADGQNGTVWCVGDSGTILSTSNGGTTWVRQTSGTTDTLYGVRFFDALRGWAVGGNNLAKVLKTTNGGISWTGQSLSAWPAGLKGISFTSEACGWVTVGWSVPDDGHHVLHTTDGGSTWSDQRIPPPPWAEVGPLNRIFFKDSLCGWVGGGMWISPIMGVIYQTTNGGANWTLRYTWMPFSPPPWDYPSFEGLDFSFDTLNGWACGEGIDENGGVVDELIIRTRNGSQWTWQYHEVIPRAKGLRDIAACDSLNGWAVGRQGFILRTTNGRTWSSYPSGVTDDLYGVDFVDTASGWACGANGTILKYSGGVGIEEDRGQGIKGPRAHELRITPNPFTSSATVSGHPQGGFAVYDISGRLIRTYQGERFGEDLSPGVYFLVPREEGAKPVRVVKLR